MKTLIDTFRDFVEKEQLFTKEDKLLLACSGGLDSTVLAHVLHAEGYDFAIAHMNFQLRGEASDGDAAFVEELARTLEAKFYCKAVDVKGEALPGESTQMTARRLRYLWFFHFRLNNQYDYLLTAHHAEDNLETFLINLIRGSGLNGLSGIKPQNGYRRRPLLEISKDVLKLYADEHKLIWREDASNATEDYLRNRIRHNLTPMLQDEFNLTSEGWIRTARNLRDDLSLRAKGYQSIEKEYTESGANYSEIKKLNTPLAFLKSLTYQIGKNYGFTHEQVRQMLKVKGTKLFETNRSCAYVVPDCIRFESYNGKPHKSPLEPIDIDKLPFPSDEESLTFNTHKDNSGIYIDLGRRPINLESPFIQYLAPTSIPLHLRPRQKGDRFQPLGMGGKTKKVKDYMIDEKIPVWLRDRIYLLVNDEDEIMAIPGYCISEKFKVLPEHTEVLQVLTP